MIGSNFGANVALAALWLVLVFSGEFVACVKDQGIGKEAANIWYQRQFFCGRLAGTLVAKAST